MSREQMGPGGGGASGGRACLTSHSHQTNSDPVLEGSTPLNCQEEGGPTGGSSGKPSQFKKLRNPEKNSDQTWGKVERLCGVEILLEEQMCKERLAVR